MLMGIQQMRFKRGVFKWRCQLEAKIPNLCHPLKLSLQCSSQNSGRERLAAGGHFHECDCDDCRCWCMRWSSIDRRLNAKTKTCGGVEKRTRCIGKNMGSLFSPLCLPDQLWSAGQHFSWPVFTVDASPRVTSAAQRACLQDPDGVGKWHGVQSSH